MANKKKGGLGRGLDALFADVAPLMEGKASSVKEDRSSFVDEENRIIYVDINNIKPNKSQPRKNFNEEKLQDLANSIKSNGVIQPLVVRKSGDIYELVAGERRWRASKIAGLKNIPCIVRNFDDKQNMIVAIIENMQREDLDPIDEANGLRTMIKKLDMTQEEASAALGKSRAYIANSMRLLNLPEKIQKLVSDGAISAAHGRTLMGIKDKNLQIAMCDKILKSGLSVRATEKLVEKAKDDSRPARERKIPHARQEMDIIESDLRSILGTKVKLTGDGRKGKIEIEYYSVGELNELIDMLKEIRRR